MPFDMDFVAMHRLRFISGVGIVGSIITVVNILTFAKVWEGTFQFYGIPTVAVYTLFPLMYIAICWLVGYLYDTKGLWKAETKFGNKRQNDEFLEMYDNVKLIKKYLNIPEDELKTREI